MKIKILLQVSFFAMLCLFILPVMGQNKAITGKITDLKDGSPLVGVAVVVQGSAIGTTTDALGVFKLNVPALTKTLVITYIGYKRQEIILNSSVTYNIKMEADLTTLNEVVVVSVGYGTLDKREVSSAITHVAGGDLLSVAGNNPLMSLQGKVAGLTISNTGTADPNSSPTLQLRGVSSRNAGLGPLFVINGIPGGNIDNINQNDIESVDVLKGGAAAAIYGTRGSNGVVIITTKKGSSQSRLIYDNYESFDYITNRLNVLSHDNFITDRVNNKQGQDYGGNTDWLKSLSHSPAFSQKHTVQLSGGSGKNNYFASADYRNANGLDLRADKKEYGARINLNHTSADDIYTVTLSVAPRKMTTDAADYIGFNNALTLNPTLPAYTPTGQYNYINTGFFSNNPIENAKVNIDQLLIKELDVNSSFKVNILRNLSSMVTISEITRDAKHFNFSPSTRTTIQHANLTNKTNYAAQDESDTDQQNIEWTSNYSLNTGKHSFKLLGGYSYSYFNFQEFSANNYDFPFNFYQYNNLGSGTYNGGAAGNGQNAVFSTQNSSKLISLFGRLNYDFDHKYIVTASLRHEGSSKFGENHKWGDFPAVSAAWRLTEEDFLKDKFSWLSDLKLRSDYGITGNQDFNSYQSLLLYGGGGYYAFNGVQYQVYGPTQNINPDLRWEKAINFNAGIDFGVFKNRISGSLDYYIRTDKDLLGSYNVPLPPNPQPTTYANVGTMKNSGIELQLNATIVQSGSVKYNISLVGAFNQNKFISFSNDIYKGSPFQDVASLPAPGSPGNIQRIQEGHSIGEFYLLKSAGVDPAGTLLVYKKDGTIVKGNTASNDDKQFVGNGLPKLTASISNTVRYKNLDLSVFLRGAFGYKIFNTNAFYIGTPSTQSDANVLKSAYDPNSKYSKLTNTSTTTIASDYFLESGSFVKIDNIALGYTHTVSSKYLHGFRIYATGRNLHTFTKYTGGDPDLVPVNGLTPGVNNALNYYPSSLQLILGAQITF